MHRWDTLQRLLGRGSEDLVPLVARSTERTEDEANDLLQQSSEAVARQVRTRGVALLPGLGRIRAEPSGRPRFELGPLTDEPTSDPEGVAWMAEVEADRAALEEACRTAARALEAAAVTSRGVRWPGLGLLLMNQVPGGLQPGVRWDRRFTGALTE